MEFKGRADPAPEDHPAETLRRRKLERQSHPPLLSKALSTAQAHQTTWPAPAERPSCTDDVASDADTARPRAGGGVGRAMSRSNSGNYAAEEVGGGGGSAGGADGDVSKLARKHRGLEDAGGGSQDASSPRPGGRSQDTGAAKISTAAPGLAAPAPAPAPAGHRRSEDVAALQQLLPAPAPASALGAGSVRGRGREGGPTRSRDEAGRAEAVPESRPAEPTVKLRAVGGAGGGAAVAAAAAAAAAATMVVPPPGACTGRITGRVMAENKGSLFMESAPGIVDVFIPGPICRARTYPVQVGTRLLLLCD